MFENRTLRANEDSFGCRTKPLVQRGDVSLDVLAKRARGSRPSKMRDQLAQASHGALERFEIRFFFAHRSLV